MKTVFTPTGVCSRRMEIELENGIIKDLKVIGGCSGNLSGISKLVKDRPAKEVIDLLRGTRCGMKPTSCPDQLSYGLEIALAEEKRAQNG